MSKPLVVRGLRGEDFPVWVLDFESAWDDQYSLSVRGMTTTLYVRDPRFRAHGASVIEPDGTTYWVTHGDLPEFFGDKEAWSKRAFLAHNTAFDGLIAHHHYGIEAIPFPP